MGRCLLATLNFFSTAKLIELESVLKGVQPRVTDLMNTELLKLFVVEEVQFALKQMKSDTAPGPDGLPYFIRSFGAR